MASNVKRDHHRWTRDIKAPQDTTIDVEGDLIVDVSGGQFTIQDNTSGDPDLIINNTTDTVFGANLIFKKGSGAVGEDDDATGNIIFYGYNDNSGTPEELIYAKMVAQIHDATDGEESGRLSFEISSHNGTSHPGLILQGGSVAEEVDITIGNGTASQTNITGILKITGNTITSPGALEIDPGGQLSITGQNVSIDAETNLYLDGGGDTYIREHDADVVRHVVGNDALMSLTEAGNEGNTVSFGDSGVGFVQFEPSFDATDTMVLFNQKGNKAHLTMTADVTDVHLVFPNVSCNCQLVVLQDGTGGWDVTNWKTFDEALGNESTVIWSGGSAPGLTETADKLDILSFYWDNDNHKAYGVASTNF